MCVDVCVCGGGWVVVWVCACECVCGVCVWVWMCVDVSVGVRVCAALVHCYIHDDLHDNHVYTIVHPLPWECLLLTLTQ